MFTRRKIFLAIFVVLALAVSSVWVTNVFASFAGGTGTAGDPYQIATCSQLQEAGSYVTSNFILTNDIDCSATASWNSGAGFLPIGTSTTNKFTGNFNGAGYKISGLTINRTTSTSTNIGLFGYTSATAVVQKVGLVQANITGYNNVGALVGYNLGTTSESYAVANVTIIYNSGAGYAGGLVGFNAGNIVNCYSRGSVNGPANTNIGGLVGRNETTSSIISKSYSASVNNATNGYGFLASGYTTLVTNSFWDINISGKVSSTGGTGTTSSALMTPATLSAWDLTTIWAIDASYNNGYPYLRNNDIGVDTVREVATLADLQNIANNPGDRFIQTADIDATSTSAWNGGEGFVPIPIFSGQYDGNGFKIMNLTISSSTRDYTGVFGQNRGIVNNFKIADSRIIGKTYVGGIAGYNWGTISRSRLYRINDSSSQVTGYSNIGGITGYNNAVANVTESYSIANVATTYNGGTAYAAGLVGRNDGYIANSYARGMVSAAGLNLGVAGFVGQLSTGARIVNSYAATVINLGTSNGLVFGGASAAATNSFWDINVSGQTTSTGGTGTTSVALMTPATLSAWDLSTIWAIDASRNNGYPYLRNNDTGVDRVIEIATVADLQNIASNPGDRFIQTADIDATSTSAWNGGEGFTPITYFYGKYDGNGFNITNMTISSSTRDYVGVFGQNRGVVNNFKIADSSFTGRTNVGSIVGYNWGYISRSQSYRLNDSSNKVTGYSNIGGLTGYNNAVGEISQSYAISNVTTTFNSGTAYTGGLVGVNAGAILNCYARGIVTGAGVNSAIGGLVGSNSLTTSIISKSFASSVVTNGATVGGLVYHGYSNFNTNSFWDINVSGLTNTTGGTGTTSLALSTSTTFSAWDLSTIWGLDENRNNGYPYLREADAGVDRVFEIRTIEDLQNIKNNPGDRFLQTADIDATSTLSWNAGAGFDPIDIFYGRYEGNGSIITNLTINRPTEDYVGVFAQNRGTINNFKIADSSFTGKTYVGSVAGYNWGTLYRSKLYRLNNSSSQVTGYSNIGGLTGYNNAVGVISQSYAVSNVTTTYNSGTAYAAGLVGVNAGAIYNSYARGSVNGAGVNSGIAGLVARNDLTSSIVSKSFAASVINGNGGNGFLYTGYVALITNSFWDVTVSGKVTGGAGTGKTTLQMKTLSTFTDAGWDFESGNVWHMDPEGLKDDGYPYLNPPILPSIEIWTVDDLQNISVNSDRNYIQMANIDASATASWNGGAGFLPIVNFTGTYNGNGFHITNLTINRPTTDYVGVFAQNRGTVNNFKIADSSFTGKTYVGSIAGYNWGTIYQSHSYRLNNSSNQVTGYSVVGGLIGYNNAVGTISQSYAISNVTTTYNSGTAYAAGLVGVNAGAISNCYARGTVTGAGVNSGIAGLVGRNDNTLASIAKSFAASVITGSAGYGLVYSGYTSVITNSFWDINISGKASSNGGTGTTTTAMKTLTTFTNAGWDFATIWGLQTAENSGYPYLRAGAPGYFSLALNRTGQGAFTVNGENYFTPVSFASGASATILATASSGWAFISWDDESTSTSRIVTMDTDKSFTALFTENATSSPSASTTLTIDLLGQGSFTVNGSPYISPVEFASGTSATVVASSSPGWSFAQWEDDSTNTTRILTMSENKNLSALFIEEATSSPSASTTLTIDLLGQGSFTVNGSPYISPVEFASGASATVVASSSPGWSFVDWEDESTSSTRLLTMSINRSISALFTEDATSSPSTSYILTITKTGQGTVLVNGSPYSSPLSFDAGTGITLLAEPSASWDFDRWDNDATSLSRSLVINTNTEIGATFVEQGSGYGVVVPPAPVITQISSPGSGGTTLMGRINNLIMIGNLEDAASLRSEYKHILGGGEIILFTKNLSTGSIDKEVKLLQQYLNTHGFIIARTGLGSPGRETVKFGASTRQALIKFQEKYREDILAPSGLKKGNGIFGMRTRNKINQLLLIQ